MDLQTMGRKKLMLPKKPPYLAINWSLQPLGKIPDITIARLLNVDEKRVYRARTKLGIRSSQVKERNITSEYLERAWTLIEPTLRKAITQFNRGMNPQDADDILQQFAVSLMETDSLRKQIYEDQIPSFSTLGLWCGRKGENYLRDEAAKHRNRVPLSEARHMETVSVNIDDTILERELADNIEVALRQSKPRAWERYLRIIRMLAAGSRVKAEELEAMFGTDVASIVKFCTDEAGYNRRTRKALTYARMQADIAIYHFEGRKDWIDDAIRVKLADRIANISASLHGDKPDLFQMYARERVAFGQALFVSGVCDLMWDAYEDLLSK